MRFYARQLSRDGARHSPSLTGRVVLGPVGPVTASRGVRARWRRGASKNINLAVLCGFMRVGSPGTAYGGASSTPLPTAVRTRKHCYQHWPRVRNIGHGRLAIRSSRPAGSVRPAPGRQYQKSPSEREQIRNSSRPGQAPGPWPMLAIWPMLVAMLPRRKSRFAFA